MGDNSAGVGVATNAMVCDMDKGVPGIPYHVMLRSILNSHSSKMLSRGFPASREPHRRIT